jgi:hypothetical protein
MQYGIYTHNNALHIEQFSLGLHIQLHCIKKISNLQMHTQHKYIHIIARRGTNKHSDGNLRAFDWKNPQR